MTVFKQIENWNGDNTGFVERVPYVASDGTVIESYDELREKPLINGVVLQGDLTLDELNIQEKGDYASAEEVTTLEENMEKAESALQEKINEVDTKIPTKIGQLENDANYTTQDYVDKLIGDIDSILSTLAEVEVTK